LLPSRNRRDLEEIPAEAREKLKLVWIERIDDALAAALSAPEAAATESESVDTAISGR
jgi:ATP-dependent Lon protease